LNIGFPALSGWLAAPVRHGSLLGMTISPNPYRSFRFPAEIIDCAFRGKAAGDSDRSQPVIPRQSSH
jgi:hypothetical protein